MTSVQRFFALLKPNSKEIRNLYVFAIFNGAVSLSLPLGIQSIINLIQGGETSAAWIVLVSVVILGYFLSGLLQIMQLRITEDLQKDIFTRSAFEFTYRIPRIKMKELYFNYAPELMNRFFDTISIQKGIAKILLEFSAAGLQIIFGLILLSFYHPFFIIFSILVLFISFIIGNYIFQRGLNSSVKESKYKYKVAFWLEEVARSNTAFRLSCSSNYAMERTDSLVNVYQESREKHFKILLSQYYLFILFKILIAAGFLLMGGILVFNQQMNLGQFVAAEIVVLLLINSTEKLFLTLESVYDLLTSIQKIGEVTDLELENQGGLIDRDYLNNDGIEIEINHLNFKYPDSPFMIINDFSLKLAKNEKVCITGTNGSGKATLMKLLTAYYEPESGSILYNNLPINNYNISYLRSQIGFVTNEDRIFNGSVYENLTLGKTYSTADINNIISNLHLSDYIGKLPQGYDTMIGPHGRKLSNSIYQKLLLARTLLKNPRLLLIEDTLKGLELAEKIQIIDYIISISENRTVILISKDEVIQSKVDTVIDIDSGKIKTITKNKNI